MVGLARSLDYRYEVEARAREDTVTSPSQGSSKVAPQLPRAPNTETRVLRNNAPRSDGIVFLGLRFTGGRFPAWFNFVGFVAVVGMAISYILALAFGGDWYLVMGAFALLFLGLGYMGPRGLQSADDAADAVGDSTDSAP